MCLNTTVILTKTEKQIRVVIIITQTTMMDTINMIRRHKEPVHKILTLDSTSI
jgi:hypothetical protein